ncbi:MAG: hypothetical protein JF626_17290 [Polaromonas sp.]|nr:hypothetical protein [Polaromonas sp.]
MLFKGKKHAPMACTALLAIFAAGPSLSLAAPLAPSTEATPSNATAAPASVNPATSMALVSASPDARQALRWVVEFHDNQDLPFVIVDKKGGRIFVFEANGQLRGASPALTGLAPGDHAIAGMDQRSVASLRDYERTTPAGRFVSEPGHNLQGEAIVWIDYTAKLAIHRLPVSFYETVVGPVLGKSRGIVYVLPETQPLQRMLGALQLSQR